MTQNEILKNAMTELEILRMAIFGTERLIEGFEQKDGSLNIPPFVANDISFNLSHIRFATEKLNLYLHSNLSANPEILPQPIKELPVSLKH